MNLVSAGRSDAGEAMMNNERLFLSKPRVCTDLRSMPGVWPTWIRTTVGLVPMEACRHRAAPLGSGFAAGQGLREA